MPSQFSAIGFDVKSGEDLAALATQVADDTDKIKTPAGMYMKWAPASGEQLWLQVKPSGDAMGMNPHFAGQSRVRVALESRVRRDTHTPLDATFLCWANPPAGATTGGEYPFAFDCPDAATYGELAFPSLATVQVAAFAQQISVYPSEHDYDAAQRAQGQSFASRSFIPSGLISPGGEPVTPPEPHALFVGHVVNAGIRRNSITGTPFWWALVDTLGGTYDVVIDPTLLTGPIVLGNIVSGWFWLSGQLQVGASSTESTGRGWFQRLTGR
ncbi:MAG TPA: hypothetical protein VNJ02_03440 [Vicinamibacterales bacterium]|nr:hypothetical protein [Vicinamibacterales bacterium]